MRKFLFISLIVNFLLSDTALVPVHMFYHKSDKDHFYSTDRKRKKVWKHKGVAFQAFSDSTLGTVPIYEFYHKGDKNHFYSTDRKRKKVWKYKSVAFWAFPDSVVGSIPVYQFYHKGDKDHFYSTDRKRKKVWKYEGVAFWAKESQKPDSQLKSVEKAIADEAEKIEEADSLAYHISSMYGCQDRNLDDKILDKFKKFPHDYNEKCGANNCWNSSCSKECHWNDCFLLSENYCGPSDNSHYNTGNGLLACIFENNILSKHDFLLFFDDNLEKLNSSDYHVIKSETDKMVENFIDNLKLDNLHVIKYSEKEIVNQYFDEDGYLNALLSMNNPSEYEAQALRNMYYVNEYVINHYEKNRIIDFNKTIDVYEPSWEEVISYLGGYSELAKNKVTKDNAPQLFNVKVVLSSIELIDDTKCKAHIEIKGNSDFGLKYHNILDTELSYEGEYDLDEFVFSDIYHLINYPKYLQSVLPAARFLFPGNKYLSDTDISVYLHKVLPEIVSLADPIEKTIRMMVDDMVSDSEYKIIDPLYVEMYDRLINYGFDEGELNKMTLKQTYESLYRYLVEEKKTEECVDVFFDFKKHLVPVVKKCANNKFYKKKKELKDFEDYELNYYKSVINKIEGANNFDAAMNSFRGFTKYGSPTHRGPSAPVRTWFENEQEYEKFNCYVTYLKDKWNKNQCSSVKTAEGGIWK